VNDLQKATLRYTEHNDRIERRHNGHASIPPVALAPAAPVDPIREHQAEKILVALEKYLRGGRRDCAVHVYAGKVTVQLTDFNSGLMTFEAEKPDFRDALAHALSRAELAEEE